MSKFKSLSDTIFVFLVCFVFYFVCKTLNRY